MATPAAHLALVTTEKARPRHAHFDVKTLKGLKAPPKRIDTHGQEVVNQVTYWDVSTKGFGLRISSAGTKTWIWMGRVPKHGQRITARYHLGPYAEHEGGPGLTLAMARRKAHDYQQAADRGDDPGQHLRDAKTEALTRSAQTFRRVAEEFLATHHPKKKKELAPSTLRRYRGLLLGPDMKDWFARPLASLTRSDMIDLLHRMQRRKRIRGKGKLTTTSNRMLAVLRKLFKWSIQRNLILLSPANDIEPPAAEIPRDRHLYGNQLHGQPNELALLWRACESVGPFGPLPKLLILTGQRLSEVAGMRQEELLDLDDADPRWLIPGSRTKNRKVHLVPLSPLAVQTIRSVTRMGNSSFIFSGSGLTPFSGVSSLKKRIDAQIDLLKREHPDQYDRQFVTPWRFHDLRRTFKTGLAELGVNADVRDALVNHTPQGLSAHYDHGEFVRGKREAMQTWERAIKELLA
ncbi:MAG: integrase arm-type DNA-binding domain-containing protein [Nitrospira sp.]|nr:integrase arm-type DNA-binding domain-containing protein [Nitrospira sp.]